MTLFKAFYRNGNANPKTKIVSPEITRDSTNNNELQNLTQQTTTNYDSLKNDSFLTLEVDTNSNQNEKQSEEFNSLIETTSNEKPNETKDEEPQLSKIYIALMTFNNIILGYNTSVFTMVVLPTEAGYLFPNKRFIGLGLMMMAIGIASLYGPPSRCLLRRLEIQFW